MASHACVAPLTGLHLLLGYHNYYAIHGSPYTFTHVLIENTLVQHKWPRIRAGRCVDRIECLKAITSIMSFIVVPV